MNMREYKWNLKSLYKSQKDWDKGITQLRRLIGKYTEQNSDVSTISLIKSVLKLEKRIDVLTYRLGLYIQLKIEMNPANEKLKFKELEFNNILNSYTTDVTNFEHAILKLSKTRQKNILNNQELKYYKPRLESIIERRRKSTQKEERILNYLEPLKDKLPNIYNNILSKNVSYQDIRVQNDTLKRVKHTNIRKLESSNNREIRRKTYETKINGLDSTKGTFAQTLNSFYQYNKLFSKTNKYKSPVDFVLREDEIKESLVEDILDTVVENKPVIEDFIKYRKKVLKVKNYYSFDDKAESFDYKSSINKSFKSVIDAFEIFGPEAKKLINKLKKEKNLYITNKPEIPLSYYGYCISMGGHDPYVFIYFQNDLDSAMTLAHELGHAIHQTKLNKHNDFWNQDTSLIIHEIASYTHELVFMLSLLKNTQNKITRKKILSKLVKYYYDVLYKKALITKYELFLTKQADRNRAFDPQTLSNKYMDIQEEFFGGIVKFNKYSEKEWIGQERLFWDFYELKYVIAFSLANKIAHRIMEGNVFYKKQFQNLMKMGDDIRTAEHFAKFNLKLSDIPELVQDGFDKMEELLEELKILR